MKKGAISRWFDNKQFVQIFAVVMAVCLWVVVAMTNNDTISKTIRNVPVDLDFQTANLQNLQLKVIGDPQFFVDVEVRGPRTEVGQLTADSPELATTLRVGQITEKGAYTLSVIPAYEDVGKLPYEIVSYSPETIQVKMDRIGSKTFKVDPVVNGVSTAPPYVFDQQYATPQRVLVTGPEEELEKISGARAVLELTQTLERTYADDVPVELVDVQGDAINLADKHLSLDVEEVQLVVSVLKETELPLEIGFLNVPRSFPLDSLREYMTMSNTSVRIAGPADVVDRLTEIVLGYVDITNLRLDDNTYHYPIELKEISDQIKLRMDDVTSVTVEFDDANWDSAYFNVESIVPVNVPEGFEVTPASTTLQNVEFVGDASVLANMTSGDIVAELDLSEREITVGQTTYPVKISVPGRGLVWATGDHSVVIQVEEEQS